MTGLHRVLVGGQGLYKPKYKSPSQGNRETEGSCAWHSPRWTWAVFNLKFLAVVVTVISLGHKALSVPNTHKGSIKDAQMLQALTKKCVCVLVFVCVCMCAWMCVCVYACVHECVCVYACVHECVCVCVCVCACAHIHKEVKNNLAISQVPSFCLFVWFRVSHESSSSSRLADLQVPVSTSPARDINSHCHIYIFVLFLRQVLTT